MELYSGAISMIISEFVGQGKCLPLNVFFVIASSENLVCLGCL